MPRYFTLAEAERMLPEVDQALRDALFHKAEYQNADAELKRGRTGEALQSLRTAAVIADSAAFSDLLPIRAST